MSVAPLHRGPVILSRGTAPRRAAPSHSGMARRRQFVTWTKRLLPVVAVLLLATIVLWPEISRQVNSSRFKSRHGLTGDFQAGRLVNVRYRGVDGSARPYTVTADQAQQDGTERINLVNPKGDLTSVNGSWTFVQSNDGVYIQHAGLLDMSGEVTIFRDNGVTLRTPSAAMDLKTGAAAGNEKTHAEGPFGTLDAQGFALVDKGAVIQFQGASRLLLNGSHQ
jgi:lipopolysaccharide export system protein LptC